MTNTTTVPHRVSQEDIGLLQVFLEGAGRAQETFRYFRSRPTDVIREHVCTWLLLRDGDPVAYGHLDRDQDIVWLGLAVQERHQGQGHGRRMLALLLQAARANGVRRVRLSVDHDNDRAIRLYESSGFQRVGEAKALSFYECDLKPPARAVVSSVAFAGVALEPMVEAARRAGFALEFSSGLPFSPTAESVFLAAPVERFAHNYFPAPAVPFVVNLASADPAQQQRSIDHCVRGIQLSHAVGAPFFSAHAGFAVEVVPDQLGGHPLAAGPTPRDAAWQRFVHAVRQVLARTFHLPVGFLIENHVVSAANRRPDGSHPLLCADPDEVLRLIDEIDDARLGALCDTGHWTVTARTLGFDRRSAIARTLPHVRCVHHSDNDGLTDDNGVFDEHYWFLPFRDHASHAVHVLETRGGTPSDLTRMNDLLFPPGSC